MSGTNLSITPDDIFVACQLFRADRPTGMQLARRDSDLSPHAEFAAISKLGRAVMNDDPGIDFTQKSVSGLYILGHDRLSMMRAVVIDVGDRFIEIRNHTYRNDRIQIFGVPIGVISRDHASIYRLRRGIAPDFTARSQQIANQQRQKIATLAIDQQSLGRATYAGAPHLRIEDNPSRLVAISRGIDIGMTNAVQVLEDRNPAFCRHALDQSTTATWNDEVDLVGHGQHDADRRAIGCR